MFIAKKQWASLRVKLWGKGHRSELFRNKHKVTYRCSLPSSLQNISKGYNTVISEIVANVQCTEWSCARLCYLRYKFYHPVYPKVYSPWSRYIHFPEEERTFSSWTSFLKSLILLSRHTEHSGHLTMDSGQLVVNKERKEPCWHQLSLTSIFQRSQYLINI